MFCYLQGNTFHKPYYLLFFDLVISFISFLVRNENSMKQKCSNVANFIVLCINGLFVYLYTYIVNNNNNHECISKKKKGKEITKKESSVN